MVGVGRGEHIRAEPCPLPLLAAGSGWATLPASSGWLGQVLPCLWGKKVTLFLKMSIQGLVFFGMHATYCHAPSWRAILIPFPCPIPFPCSAFCSLTYLHLCCLPLPLSAACHIPSLSLPLVAHVLKVSHPWSRA